MRVLLQYSQQHAITALSRYPQRMERHIIGYLHFMVLIKLCSLYSKELRSSYGLLPPYAIKQQTRRQIIKKRKKNTMISQLHSFITEKKKNELIARFLRIDQKITKI